MWFLVVILLILFLLFSPVIKVWRSVRKFQKDYESAMNKARQQNGGAKQQDDANREFKERYRRYSDETGEYVSFEEMEGKPEAEKETNTQQTSSSSSSKYQEEMVSDAEFEEI